MGQKTRAAPDNADGLWRIYHGSSLYHRYCRSQLNASWQRQEALCGRVTTTGNGSYSKLDPKSPHYKICRKCEALLKGQAVPAQLIVFAVNVLPRPGEDAVELARRMVAHPDFPASQVSVAKGQEGKEEAARNRAKYLRPVLYIQIRYGSGGDEIVGPYKDDDERVAAAQKLWAGESDEADFDQETDNLVRLDRDGTCDESSPFSGEEVEPDADS